ncbi:RNA polymerase [Mangrovihabitans endophyticus]|uniref:RNA polymerase n=1 Tax=Mangrovihabitans endophyticus TaxID=1751298 RepID=A0A8J3BVJ3_9ACTN|nr:RNA polymerase [Mangrovihabitans endophyticus]
MTRRRLLAAAVAATLAGCGTARERAPASAGRKRGIGTWYFADVDQALAQIDVAWYYTWSVGPGRITAPGRAEFVPMVWGAEETQPAALERAAKTGQTILGFNEPDVREQANLRVEEALDLWPRLQATGRRLGSPAVSAGADTPGGWLDRFLAGTATRRHRVDFVALHWYGADPATATAELGAYLEAVHDRYRLPIWLTEFALADFTAGVEAAWYAPRADQAAFVAAAIPMLESLPYVERYAWFALSDRDSDYRTGLYDERGRLTEAGTAYRSA